MQPSAAVADPFWLGRIQERLHEEMEDCDAVAVALEEALQKDRSDQRFDIFVILLFYEFVLSIFVFIFQKMVILMSQR